MTALSSPEIRGRLSTRQSLSWCVIALATAGCTTTAPLSGRAGRSTIGVVTGRITCYGPGPGLSMLAGGMVDAVAGRVAWPSPTGTPVLPKTVVAKQTVAPGKSYRFEVESGPYVLRLHDPRVPGTFDGFREVSVKPGQVTNVDVDLGCL